MQPKLLETNEGSGLSSESKFGIVSTLVAKGKKHQMFRGTIAVVSRKYVRKEIKSLKIYRLLELTNTNSMIPLD